MIKVEREFLKELRDYVINSLNDAIYHNSPHRIPPIQADLDKIDNLLEVEDAETCSVCYQSNMLGKAWYREIIKEKQE